MFRKIFVALLFLLVSIAAFATKNAYFTIKVGNFKNPKIEDFQSVRALGYVYAERLQDEVYEVYLGRFDEQASAQDVAEQIKRQGYLGAKVEAKAVDEGELVTVVQIATKTLGEVPNWEKFIQAGPLHSILTTNQVKFVTGPYKTMDEARKQLAKAKRVGFSDAFIKNVNTVFLHRVTPFEMSGVKQELIPIAFEDNTSAPATTADKNKTTINRPTATTPTPIPPTVDLPIVGNTTTENTNAAANATQQSFEGVMPDRLVAKSTDIANPVVPTIRTNVKRRSVLNLQTALKGGQFYQSSLDGLYGKGTATAYVKARDQHRQLQKYSILAQYMDYSVGNENESQLQKAINNLAEDPFTAKAILAKSESPTARAYLAYLNFINQGASTLVNNLMNRAIRDAFKTGKKLPESTFDYTATYAYNDLNQLLLHLRYVQAADLTQTATPCWLFINHPRETAFAFANTKAGNYTIQNCGGFDSWQEIQTVQAIATDLNAATQLNTSLLSEGAAERTQLFITPKPYSAAEATELEKWNVDLWKGIDTWAKSDPVHQQMVVALKVSYFQSQVLLEDYFMDRGFNVDEAKGLALAVMQSVVDYHLERFQ